MMLRPWWHSFVAMMLGGPRVHVCQLMVDSIISSLLMLEYLVAKVPISCRLNVFQA